MAFKFKPGSLIHNQVKTVLAVFQFTQRYIKISHVIKEQINQVLPAVRIHVSNLIKAYLV